MLDDRVKKNKSSKWLYHRYPVIKESVDYSVLNPFLSF